jgi:hypothetical protein
MIVMITAMTPSLKASSRPASVENRGALINIFGLSRRAKGYEETGEHDQHRITAPSTQPQWLAVHCSYLSSKCRPEKIHSNAVLS